MIKQLKKVHLQTYEFFDAIRPTTLDLEAWNPYFLNPIPDWFKLTGGNELKYKIGCLGCLLSHMEVIKLSINEL